MIYRREIDGLRAIAVLPVILFHAGVEVFSGGYIGVDIFFVISGYLITTIILSEKQAGKFTIINFYERRARRILPALFFVILASLPFSWYWMLPSQLKDYAQSLAAVSIFSSNILFWLESGYFEAAAELKPFLHTWSLAVEEQYYLLFPLLILVTWQWGKQTILKLLVLIGLCSFSLTQWGIANDPSANFYLLPFRLWELLIGSLTAFHLLNKSTQTHNNERKSTTKNQTLSAIGLTLIAYAIFNLDDQTPFPGLYALLPTVGTALIILYATETTFTAKLLGHKALVGIGLISYSAYLWHQPLFAFARLRSINPPSIQLMASLGLLALILAYITWKYIEQPFRNKRRFNRQQIFRNATSLSAVILCIGALGHISNGFNSRNFVEGEPISETKIHDRIRPNYGLDENCKYSFTLSKKCRTDDSPEIVVWGDSLAMHLIPGIIASKPSVKIIQMTKSVCGPLIGLAPTDKTYTGNWADGCIKFNKSVAQWIENNSTIRYAVLSSPFSQYLADKWNVKTEQSTTPATEELALKHFSSTLDFLVARGIKPVIFAPPPSDGRDIGSCLVKTNFFGDNPQICNIENSQYQSHRSRVIQFLKKIENKHRIVWLNESLCTDDTCSTMMRDVFLYRDQHHLSHEGSRYLGEQMDFYKLITSGWPR